MFPAIRKFASPLFVAILGVLAACSEEPQTQTPPPPEVAVQTVGGDAVPLELTYTARTVGSREVEVRARVSGILLKRRFEEGSRVRQGQPMFLIDPEPVRARVASARAEVAVAKARLDEARRQKERVLPLFEQNAVSQSRRDEAVSGVRSGAGERRRGRIESAHGRARSRVHRRARADRRAHEPRSAVGRQPRVDRSGLEPADEDRAGRSAVRRVRGARSGSGVDSQQPRARQQGRSAEREAAARERLGVSRTARRSPSSTTRSDVELRHRAGACGVAQSGRHSSFPVSSFARASKA